ncbi:zinc-binding dehydrogenase [Nocardioides sp. B-3]|uniref:zinc-binding dehydrogenase n=1 Tax=Nocardioides sp. B-3 TaxID=2895565 RepID=UPI002153002C|nr:zinc-binding dehydrogenase [Nocardioides sp. B-3]UUZ57836.1 zinc-binding dehydrogenase [Nocardioides sp. B-3]
MTSWSTSARPVGGGYASKVPADAERLHELPLGPDPGVAVAAIGTGRTAVGLLDQIRLGREDRVIVTSAAGGLGVLLLRELRAVGATSVGLAGGSAKVRAAREAGPRTRSTTSILPGPKRCETPPGSATVLLDGVGGEVAETAARLLVPGGRVLSFGWSSGRRATGRDHVVVDVPLGPKLLSRPGGPRSLEEDALAAAADGTRVPVVGSRYPLEDAALAHRDLEQRRTVGKVVLEP